MGFSPLFVVARAGGACRVRMGRAPAEAQGGGSVFPSPSSDLIQNIVQLSQSKGHKSSGLNPDRSCALQARQQPSVILCRTLTEMLIREGFFFYFIIFFLPTHTLFPFL